MSIPAIQEVTTASVLKYLREMDGPSGTSPKGLGRVMKALKTDKYRSVPSLVKHSNISEIVARGAVTFLVANGLADSYRDTSSRRYGRPPTLYRLRSRAVMASDQVLADEFGCHPNLVRYYRAVVEFGPATLRELDEQLPGLSWYSVKMQLPKLRDMNVVCQKQTQGHTHVYFVEEPESAQEPSNLELAQAASQGQLTQTQQTQLNSILPPISTFAGNYEGTDLTMVEETEEPIEIRPLIEDAQLTKALMTLTGMAEAHSNATVKAAEIRSAGLLQVGQVVGGAILQGLTKIASAIESTAAAKQDREEAHPDGVNGNETPAVKVASDRGTLLPPGGRTPGRHPGRSRNGSYRS